MGELQWDEIDAKALAVLDRLRAAWHSREGSPVTRETAVERLIALGNALARGAVLATPSERRAASMSAACAGFCLALIEVGGHEPVVDACQTDDFAYLAVTLPGADGPAQTFPFADARVVRMLLEGWGAATHRGIEIPGE